MYVGRNRVLRTLRYDVSGGLLRAAQWATIIEADAILISVKDPEVLAEELELSRHAFVISTYGRAKMVEYVSTDIPSVSQLIELFDFADRVLAREMYFHQGVMSSIERVVDIISDDYTSQEVLSGIPGNDSNRLVIMEPSNVIDLLSYVIDRAPLRSFNI